MLVYIIYMVHRYGAGLWNVAISTIFWNPIMNSSNSITNKSNENKKEKPPGMLLRAGVGLFGIGYALVAHITQYPYIYYIVPIGGLIKIHLFIDHFRKKMDRNTTKFTFDLLTNVLIGDLVWAAGFLYYMTQFHTKGITNVAK